MNKFKLKLIAPDGIKFEDEAESATLPTKEGEITILPNHMPLIALLRPGEITLTINGKLHTLVTEGGVVEVEKNEVKILADTAEDIENLDELKIIEAKKLAEHRIASAKDDVEFADAAAALEKQLAKLSILTKRKKKYKA